MRLVKVNAPHGTGTNVAQIAIIPVWFRICFGFGFPTTTGQNEITTRALGFRLNILTIIVASLATYILLGATNRRLPDDSR